MAEHHGKQMGRMSGGTGQRKEVKGSDGPIRCTFPVELSLGKCESFQGSHSQPTPWIPFSKSTAHCLEIRALSSASPGDKEQCFAKSIKQKTPTVSSLFKQSLVL